MHSALEIVSLHTSCLYGFLKQPRNLDVDSDRFLYDVKSANSVFNYKEPTK
jgi:hypothetical protein